MAERIVSPGVTARENDKSFIAAGEASLGAVVIGPTLKGPAFVPTIIKSFAEYERMFGSESEDTYIPYTVRNYLKNASSITVVRILAGGGYSFNGSTRKLAALVDSNTSKILTVFHPSLNSDDSAVELGATISSSLGLGNPISSSNSFGVKFSGSSFNYVATMSIDNSQNDYLLRVIGDSPRNSDGTSDKVYAFLNFKDEQTSVVANTPTHSLNVVVSDGNNTFSSSFTEGYDHATTPWITSQKLNSVSSNLFKFHHLADGAQTNTDVYVSIGGIKTPAAIDGVEQYTEFDVLVRRFGDTDKRPVILEQYNGCNLDPDSSNFISRRIGDRYFQYNNTTGKVDVLGNYSNNSNYLRVEVNDSVTNKAYSPTLSPRGFRAMKQTITGFTGYNLPSPSYKILQNVEASGSNKDNYSSKGYLGWDFLSKDNNNYLRPIPNGASDVSNRTVVDHGSTITIGDFNLDDLFGHTSSSLWTGALSASIDATGTSGPASSQLQFSIPMQGGFDSLNPSRIINTGTNLAAANMFGFDFTTATSTGAVAYKKAFDILSNTDEYDFNLIVTPGILQEYSSAVINKGIDTVEERGDAFYIFDLLNRDGSVNSAVSQIQGASIDSSYASTYYPWVKILDASTNKPTFVPPSVLIPGVYARNDSISAPWFAPAGLNRGGIGDAIEAKLKLSRSERDRLYEERINPIATFPGQGVVVYGQKTLQKAASALDRINVRRLLIELKKFISNSSRFLVFDQNTVQTRNKFLNIVNPYLESVQQRQGLYAFRVVMDETNNTADVIDRNELRGEVHIQPARAAEFIVLDFNVQPTGQDFE